MGERRVVVDVVSQRGPDDRELDRDVQHESADHDPGDGIVGGAEREAPRVPVADVEQPGDELEDRRRDERADGQPLGGLESQPAYVAHVEPVEQLGEDGPELHQQQRDRRGPGDHVHSLGDAVELHRPGRQVEPARQGLLVVAPQTGEERDAEADPEPEPDASRDGRTAQPGRERRRARCRGTGLLHGLRHRRRQASHVRRPSPAWRTSGRRGRSPRAPAGSRPRPAARSGRPGRAPTGTRASDGPPPRARCGAA